MISTRIGARIAVLLLLAAVGLASPARATEFRVHGLLDVVAAEAGRAFEHNWMTRGDSPFDAYGLRVFGDAQVNERLQVFSQLMLRDATTPYVDGAYLMFTPSPARDVHLLAGKVPWAIGTYGPRTYSNKNPLIGTPLMYQYHTTLLWYEVVPSADALIATAGTGQYGANYFGYPEGRGMVMIDDCYWDVGVTLAGSQRPIEYSIGVNAGTPGWGSTSKEENAGKTVLGRLGVSPWPGVRVGVSGAYGPYLLEALNPNLPPGKTASDYRQILGMADAELQAGHVELRAEGAMNTWESPIVGDLDATSGYLELKLSMPTGAFIAGRGDVIQFGKIRDSSGAERTWDANVTRFEAGVGYRFDRGAVGKLVLQRTRVDGGPAQDRNLSMVAAALSVAF